MSWEMELYNLYDRFYGNPDSPIKIEPVGHITISAQVEITVDNQGNLLSVKPIEQANARTIAPVTEDSATRGNNVAPHSLFDKLQYIAGDYVEYTDVDNTVYYTAYCEQLSAWCTSEYTCAEIKAVYKYVTHGTVIGDCIAHGVIGDDCVYKIKDIPQLTVRFNVQVGEDINVLCNDAVLHNKYIAYDASKRTEKQLCYVTGEMKAATYKHLHKLRNSTDRAKIVSANDTTGFTYRGEFRNKYEAISLSYEWSQKAHNALKALMYNGNTAYGDMSVVLWRSDLKEVPNVLRNAALTNEELPDITSVNAYTQAIDKKIAQLQGDTDIKTMLLAVDAATQGRMAIVKYCEMNMDGFTQVLRQWWLNAATVRYNVSQNKTIINTPSMYEMILCAYGVEDKKAGKMTAPKNISVHYRSLLPCLLEGRRVPNNIILNICNKASTPMMYSERYNHRRVVEVACSLIRLQGEGKMPVMYDETITDRSYLFGCLLAIADEAERRAYSPEDKKKRLTNARKYWRMFTQKPSTTWDIIYKQLQPYIKKLGETGYMYDRCIQKIVSKIGFEEFAKNVKLEPVYLLGFSQYTTRFAKENSDETESNND